MPRGASMRTVGVDLSATTARSACVAIQWNPEGALGYSRRSSPVKATRPSGRWGDQTDAPWELLGRD